MKKILVPTDFSELADAAIEVAYNIAKKGNAIVLLLNVIEAPSGSSFNVEGQIESVDFQDSIFTIEMIKKTKAQMAEILEDPRYGDVEFHREIKIGNPYHGIKSIVNEHDVDMVVMGTSGSAGLAEILVGSTTEKVVRHAKCPVLSIHKKHDSFEYKDLVFATSMDEDESDMIGVLKMIQDLYGSTIHLVRVNTPNNFERDSTTFKNLKSFAEKHGLGSYTANVFNDVTEEEGIIYFADHINADMIAMATHGRTGFAHLLSGSIAEDVVNHAERPVLTFVTKSH